MDSEGNGKKEVVVTLVLSSASALPYVEVADSVLLRDDGEGLFSFSPSNELEESRRLDDDDYTFGAAADDGDTRGRRFLLLLLLRGYRKPKRLISPFTDPVPEARRDWGI